MNCIHAVMCTNNYKPERLSPHPVIHNTVIPFHAKLPPIPVHPNSGERFDYFEDAGDGAGGSSVCVWPSARMIWPWSSCRQMTVPETHGSARTSSIGARFLGSISSIRPMICLLSLGKRRRSRHGPLMTSGFLSPAPFDPLAASAFGVVGLEVLSGIASLAGVERSVVDFDGMSDSLLISVPGVGGEAKSL